MQTVILRSIWSIMLGPCLINVFLCSRRGSRCNCHRLEVRPWLWKRIYGLLLLLECLLCCRWWVCWIYSWSLYGIMICYGACLLCLGKSPPAPAAATPFYWRRIRWPLHCHVYVRQRRWRWWSVLAWLMMMLLLSPRQVFSWSSPSHENPSWISSTRVLGNCWNCGDDDNSDVGGSSGAGDSFEYRGHVAAVLAVVIVSDIAVLAWALVWKTPSPSGGFHLECSSTSISLLELVMCRWMLLFITIIFPYWQNHAMYFLNKMISAIYQDHRCCWYVLHVCFFKLFSIWSCTIS